MNKKNLILRIVSALVMLPVVLFAVYFGQEYFLGLILILGVISLLEANKMMKSFFNNFYLGLNLITLLPLLYLFYIGKIQLVLLIMILFFLMLVLRLFYDGKDGALLRFSGHVMTFFYLSIGLGTLLFLRQNFHEYSQLGYSENAYFIFIILVTIWLSDIFAYFGGSMFGKHKLSPKISPNKTIEGSAIGFIVAVSASFFLFQYLIPSFSSGFTLVLLIVAGIGTQVGDLFESMIKRELNVKDSGDWIPGHGGILDRIDSILFAFPCVYAVLEIQQFFNL